MIQIDDLHRAGKMLIGEIPDPFCAIAHDNFLLCPAPAALPGFDVNALSKLFGGLDAPGVGSGIGIANRIALLVPSGLRENAPSLTSRVWAGTRKEINS